MGSLRKFVHRYLIVCSIQFTAKHKILKFCKQVLLIWQQVLCVVRVDMVNTHAHNFVNNEILYWQEHAV